MPIGKRLDDLINLRNENVNSIATQIGVSPQTIYSIIKRDNMKVDFDVLMKLAKRLDVSVEYFYESSSNLNANQTIRSSDPYIEKYRQLSEKNKQAVNGVICALYETESFVPDNITQLRRIPEYLVPASAGTGNFLDDSPFEIIEVGPEAPPQTSYLIRASGDSMEPKIQDGERLYIKQQDEVQNGEIGLFWYDDQVYVKRLERCEDGTFLVSLNPKYPPIQLDGSPLKCFGKVLNK